MRIAVTQVAPVAGREAAIGRARELAVAAAAAGAGLLLLPQRYAAGLADEPASVAAAAEPSDGPTATAMRGIARETGLALAFGYVERCTGLHYDSLMLIDRAGCSIANYRRTHLERRREGELFARGQWLTAMPLGRRRLGLLSGYDLAFPEPLRALRLVGCDLILVAGGPAALPLSPELLLAARAVENGCEIAFASARRGEPALVMAPDGHARARSGDEAALVLADLAAAPGGPPPLLGDRRPRLYQRLIAIEAGHEEVLV